MRFGKKACNWRSVIGVLAVGALAFGLKLEGAPVASKSKVSPVMTVDQVGAGDTAPMVRIGKIPAQLPVNPVQVVDWRNDIGTRLREAGLLQGPMPAGSVDPTALNGIAGVPANCSFDEDCEDGLPCTDDICNIGPGAPQGTGVCMHEVVENGEVGDLNGDDCNDGIDCNGEESCQGASITVCEGICVGGDEITEGTACIRETDCIGGGTCDAKGCGGTGGTACDDNQDCGSTIGTCTAGTPISCAGGQVCDENGSDAAICVTECASDGECDDGLTCNGVETCEAGLCVSPGNPCGHISNTVCLEKKCLLGGAGVTNTACETFQDCVASNTASCGEAGPYCFTGRCCNANAELQGPSGFNAIPGPPPPSFPACAESWYPGDTGSIPAAASPRCPVYGGGIGSASGAGAELLATVGPTSVGPFPNPLSNTTLFKLGDDYDSTGVTGEGTGGFIKLERMRFAGGVTSVASSRIAFEFYDENGDFVEDIFFISGTNQGSVQVVNVLELAPTLKIPEKGFILAHVLQSFGTPTARSQMFWLSTDTTDQGANDVNNLYTSTSSLLGTPSVTANFIGVCAGGDNDGLSCSTVGGDAACPGGTCNSVPAVLAFELEGDKTADGPVGGCCDGTTGTCSEILVWECRGQGGNFIGEGVNCAVCSNDSAFPANACTLDSECRVCVDDGFTACDEDADCDTGVCGPGACETAPACGAGSCCIVSTGECQDGHTESSCTGVSGTFNGLGSDCDPDCCVQPTLSGSDNCETAPATVVTVPSGNVCQGGANDGLACASVGDCFGKPCERAQTKTVTGDNSTASSTFANEDSCFQAADTPGSELGWFEKYNIVDPLTRPEDTIPCAFLLVDHCCTDPVKIPAYRIMYDSCPCGDSEFTKANPNRPGIKADARGAPFCPLDNAWQQFGPIQVGATPGDPAGDRWYPIYSSLGGNFDQYQFHVRVDACPDAVCCTGSNCDIVNVLECQASGGTFLAPPNIGTAQTFCVGQCDVGSCCTGPGECEDNQDPLENDQIDIDEDFCVNSLQGSYTGGVRCFGGSCAGGTRVGQSCSVNGDCPSSTCSGGSLALSQPSPCPVCEVIGPNNCQANDDSVTQRQSDVGLPGGGVHVADDFIPLTPTIETICTWGVYTKPDETGSPVDCGDAGLQDNFRITVFEADANGLPDAGNVVAQFSVPAANTIRKAVPNSANELLGGSLLYAFQFDISLTPITGLDATGATCYWLEIANELDGDCAWSWQTVDNANNDYSASGGAGAYGPSSARSRDMAFCLSTDFASGACGTPIAFCCACDGTCEDKTLRDCQTEISRWRVEDSCVDTVCEAGPPPNDLCGPVADLTIESITTGTTRFDNTCSNADGQNPICSELGSVAQISGDIWYTFIAPEAGTVTFSTCPVGTAAGGGIDTIIAAYRDDSNPTVCTCPSSQSEQTAQAQWITDPPNAAGGCGTATAGDENCDGVLNGGGGFITGDVDAGDCILVRVGGFPGQGSEEGAGTVTVTLDSGTETPPAPTDASAAAGHGQRYLEISTPGTEGDEFIRVTPLNIPNLTGGADVLYVGAPFTASDADLGDPGKTFTAAQLVCEPVAIDVGAFSQIAVYGPEVTPSDGANVAQYSVQRAAASCPNPTTNEDCWSDALVISMGHFGDILTPFFPNNLPQPNIGDVFGYVKKFLSDPTGLPKPLIQLTRNLVEPNAAMNFRNVSATLNSFLGNSTFATDANTAAVLCTCPSGVTCGATACTLDGQCAPGLCLGGFCTDACGRCAP